MDKKEIRVYIASPYKNGVMTLNVRLQMETADKLIGLGYYPFVPLYCHFQQIMFPRTEQDWLALDIPWVKVCDALLRLKPTLDDKEIYSYGADLEEQTAKDNKIPVFYSIEELDEYFNPKNPMKFYK